MLTSTLCPKCHVKVLPSHYYCYNCGANLKPAPPKTDAGTQAVLYIKSLLLPPFGIVWAIKYLKYPGKSRVIGIVAILITVAIFILAIKWFSDFTSILNGQVNDAMQNMYSF